MLTKCVCPTCGHSYLADSDLGDMACPRCEVLSEGLHRQPEYENGGFAPEPRAPDMAPPDEPVRDQFPEMAARFDPQTPPPMFITRDRFVRGLVFGALTTLIAGAVLGAALASISVTVPVVVAVVVAMAGGASLRSGFGGRAASQSRTRAVAAAVLIVSLGFVGFMTGSWAVERLIGTRAEQARADLEAGLESLVRQRTSVQDAGLEVVLDQQITEVERLRGLSDAQLEDYLWVQQAQLNQPLLAYGKLRVMQGPAVRLGPDAEPVRLPFPATAGILLVEFLLAAFLAARAVSPR